MPLPITPNPNDFDVNEAQTVAVYANRIAMDRIAIHDLALFDETDENLFFGFLDSLTTRLGLWPGVNL